MGKRKIKYRTGGAPPRRPTEIPELTIYGQRAVPGTPDISASVGDPGSLDAVTKRYGPVRLTSEKEAGSNVMPKRQYIEVRDKAGGFKYYSPGEFRNIFKDLDIEHLTTMRKGGGIYIKPSKRGTFTAAAKKRGKSVQGFASQVLANKDNYSPAMRKKANFARNSAKWKKEEGGFLPMVGGLYDFESPGTFEINDMMDLYSFGGWLKNNAGNILKTVAGGAMMATGVGAGAGAGLMAGGVGGMLGGIGQGGEEEEISEIYRPPVSKAKQLYDVPMQGGGNLKQLSQRTDYEGSQHEQGGIKLPGLGVEVEGDESRTGDMIHSDKIKITKPVYNRYKDMVPLKKSDIGNSVASVLKKTDKRFEKRSGDKWNDEARIATQKPYEMMSDELSQIYDIASEMNNNIIEEGSPGFARAQGGLDLSKMWGNVKEFAGEPGNAPIIGSGIGMMTNLLRKPEKVSYEQARFTPTQFTPTDTSAGIGRIKRTYGDTRERLKRINPRMYMNQLASLGAMEAETVGDYSANVGTANTQMLNRAYQTDAQTRAGLEGLNTQIAMREAEANAMNRGARRSAIDAYTSNLFTQIGQKSRDDKLYKQQDKYINMMGENLKGWREMAYPSAKQDPYALLPWNDSMPGNYPIDETQIMPYGDIDYKDQGYYTPSLPKNIGLGRRYGGRIRKLNTMRYRLNK